MSMVLKTTLLGLGVVGVLAMTIYGAQACEWSSKMSVWTPSSETATGQTATTQPSNPAVDG